MTFIAIGTLRVILDHEYVLFSESAVYEYGEPGIFTPF